MTTVSGAILEPLLRADPVGPRITYYDDATGERIELSAATLANWAAKSGNLLRDELGAGPGSRVAVLLPAHWQTAAVLFGVWWIGAQALPVPPAPAGDAGDTTGADVALCTLERLDAADAAVAGGEVAVLAGPVRPPGDRSADRGHRLRHRGARPRRSDHRRAPPGPRAAGHDGAGTARRVRRVGGRPRGDRHRPGAVHGELGHPGDLVDHLLTVLSVGGSLVQVAHPDPATMTRRAESEKTTRGNIC